MKKLIRYMLTILPFLYMVAIWIMSSHPDNVVVELPDSYWDRMIKDSLHLVEFGLLYLFFVLALAVNGKLTRKMSLFAAIIAGLYGITDEIHQSFVPSRTPTMIDVVKDIIGVTAVYFHVRFHYFKRKKSLLNKLENWGES
ncbi:VanZ family protein [Peribacillus alkalitolerans]|uniref:VanZ family protein n=1 Tax=Peribacillus alkalitolerans TaxID=1550385 RepID=UPI0013D68909|nr:VanZ family protein [Peribacillus alkalitolerans]